MLITISKQAYIKEKLISQYNSLGYWSVPITYHGRNLKNSVSVDWCNITWSFSKNILIPMNIDTKWSVPKFQGYPNV